jgi:serine/threonine-protein kinase
MSDSIPRSVVYEFGPFRLEPQHRCLTHLDGRRVAITAKAFDALLYLVEHAGTVVTRDELVKILWPRTIVEDNSLNKLIATIRRTLGEQHYIATLQGRGYQFVADVRISRAAERLEPHADKADDLTTLESGTQTLRWQSAMGRADSAAGARRQKAGLAIGGGVVLGAVTMGLTVWALLRPEPPRVVRLTMSHPSGETVAANEIDANIAISNDGQFIAYAAGDLIGRVVFRLSAIYVRPLDALSPTLISAAGRAPFFSPDGQWVGWLSRGEFQRAAVTGGPPLTIGSGSASGGGGSRGDLRGVNWGPDETIVFANGDVAPGLMRIAVGGGELEVVTTPDRAAGELDHWFPRFLPGGRHVLFTIAKAEIASSQIALLDLETGKYRVLIQGGSDAHYVPSGHIVYGSAGSLLAVPFDLEELEVGNSPVPVVESVVMKASGAASFAVADNGTLVYVTGGAESSLKRTLVWVSRDGAEEPIPVPRRNYHYVQLSPDGRHLALDIRDQENDIWVVDREGSNLRRLTLHPGFDSGPVWSPDGTHIAFTRDQAQIYWQPWDGFGVPEPLTQESDAAPFLTDISRGLAFFHANQPLDVFMIPIGDGASAGTIAGTIVLGGPDLKANATLSPDGRWLAYTSNQTGRSEVYVVPFPEVAGGGPWQISQEGGSRPRWSRSGKELFYYFIDGTKSGLMAVSVQAEPNFRHGVPQRLFQGSYQAPSPHRLVYDVDIDDQRFVMIKQAAVDDAGTQPQIVVVQNWFEELKRLVPTQ